MVAVQPGDTLLAPYYGYLWGEIVEVTHDSVTVKWKNPHGWQTELPAKFAKLDFLAKKQAGLFSYAEPPEGVL